MGESTDAPSTWKVTNILITWPSPEQKQTVNRLKEITNANVTWIECIFKVDDPSVYKNVDVLLTLLALPETKDQCPNLKYCHTVTAGIDYFQKFPIFGDPSVRWTYASGIHGAPMAEWLFMTYSAFQKEYEMYREYQKNRTFQHHLKAMQTRDLYGQRLGIVGYGSIGRQVARVADAMGMEVLAFTATPKETPESRKEGDRYRLPGTGDPDGTIPKAWFHGLDKASLHKFLEQGIDLLLLAMPLTEESRGIVGKEAFDILAKHSPYGGAFIANLARGEVIDQDALITALKTEGSGVRGAALDVTVPEPLPPDNALWDCPNCWITPHNSSQNNRYLDRGLDIFIGNLKRGWGEKFINEVNAERGY